MPLRGIALLAYFVVSLPVCFFRPFYGVLLWTVVAFANPQSFIWGAADVFPWALSVAVATIGGMFLFGTTAWNHLQSREVFLIGALWVWFTITTLISTNTPLFMHHAADTWVRWIFVSKILLIVFVTIVVVNDFIRLRILTRLIALCFGFFVAKAFPFVIMTGGAHRVYGPDRSMIADNNDLGLALNMTLPLFFFLAQTETNKWVKRGFGALFLMTIPVIFFTYSRGALVGMLIVSTFMFFRLQFKQRLALIPIIVFAVIFAITFAPESWKDRMNPNRKDAVDASAKARLNAWAYSRALAADYPLTGGGFATFTPELYNRYAPVAAGVIHGPHSIYFQVLAEHGYIGLGLYLLLMISALICSYQLARQARRRGDQEAANFANMFQFSLIAFLASGTFLGRAYFDYSFTIIACLVVLQKVVQREWMEEDAAIEEEEEVEQLGAALPYSPVYGGTA